jgi:hypothetical protein
MMMQEVGETVDLPRWKSVQEGISSLGRLAHPIPARPHH